MYGVRSKENVGHFYLPKACAIGNHFISKPDHLYSGFFLISGRVK